MGPCRSCCQVVVVTMLWCWASSAPLLLVVVVVFVVVMLFLVIELSAAAGVGGGSYGGRQGLGRRTKVHWECAKQQLLISHLTFLRVSGTSTTTSAAYTDSGPLPLVFRATFLQGGERLVVPLSTVAAAVVK